MTLKGILFANAKKDAPLTFNPKFHANEQNKTASQLFLCAFNKA